MITKEQIDAQRNLYGSPIVIGGVAVEVLTPRNKHFSILEGKTVPEKVTVKIDKGFVFGDGRHSTTKMCMEAIEKYIEPGMMVLDIGCGTGIQSIISALLGAGQVESVDIDSEAVKVTKHNAKLNNVADKITARVGNLTENVAGKYDLIVANILADPVKMLLESIDDYIHDGSIVIVSGIKNTRADEVEEIALKHFKIVEKETRDNWVCYVLRPKQ